MSTETGDAKIVGDIVADAKAMLAAETAELLQLDMLDPLTAEDMIEARELLGPEAGRLAVVRQARETKRGRPPGAKNKRSDDFARYVMSFGQDPAITLMQIQSTPPELLIEASQQQKVHSFRKDGKANVVIERMSYAEAQALRVRCAEGLLPYIHGKKPVDVNVGLTGDFNLIVPGVNIGHADAESMISGEDILLGNWSEVDDGEPE